MEAFGRKVIRAINEGLDLPVDHPLRYKYAALVVDRIIPAIQSVKIEAEVRADGPLNGEDREFAERFFRALAERTDRTIDIGIGPKSLPNPTGSKEFEI